MISECGMDKRGWMIVDPPDGGLEIVSPHGDKNNLA